jgi:hypothetical protein
VTYLLATEVDVRRKYLMASKVGNTSILATAELYVAVIAKQDHIPVWLFPFLLFGMR